MNAPFPHMTPDAQVVLFTPGMRRLIADAIESLILLLDEIDGDAEPSLGATHSMDQRRAWQATIGETDAEQEHDGREPEADDEPRFVPVFEAG